MDLIIKRTLCIVLACFLAACGSTPQPTVALSTNAVSKENLRVGFVYVAPTEEATTHIYGAACLLCYGVASALTSKLDGHLKDNVDTQELENIKQLVLEEYSQHNPSVVEVNLPKPMKKLSKFKGGMGFAKKDFRSFKDSLNVDLLVVLEIDRHGAFRSFSNYIPNGDPKGHIAGRLYAVDLSNNAYVQYYEFAEHVQPAGEWDEPPTFPNVTTSYYQAIENTKAKLRDAI